MSTSRALLVGIALAVGAAVAACSSDDASGDTGGAGEPTPDYNDPRTKEVEVLPDPLEGLPKGAEQLAKVCARGQRDAVTNGLCDGREVSSIDQLLEAIGLRFRNRAASGTNGGGGNPAFALLGHSSSLVAREVSAINPRAFVFTPPPGFPRRLPGYVVTGFARGEPFVEIAADDRQSGKLTFYLVRFELACEATHSCTPGDLLTPAVEKNWTGFSLYEDEDLKNTIADCRHCHQPGGPGTKVMLRMQELEDPWTHWFHNDRPGGLALLSDFLRAHGEEEDYGGIPAAILQQLDGRAMEDLVKGQGFDDQPNVFDTKEIELEVSTSASQQPEVNFPAGRSSTWQKIYDRSALGEFIPVPYHDVKVTDPDKLAFATDAYRQFRARKLAKSELPDIRRVFADSALPEMTMRPKPGATGRQVLVQACAQCHNARLDTSISRGRFDVTQIDAMGKGMKEAAIARMKLPASDRRHMPPAQFRSLPADALDAAVAELSK